jgi:putative MATE family efflux protein
VQDTASTLVIAVAANVLNLALEVLFVYGFDWGISGSAWGTVTAQAAAATAFVVIVVRSARREDAPLRPTRAGVQQTAVVGGPLMVRTASLLVVFLATTGLAARISDDAVAAHQIAYQVFLLLALSMDALAIAAQAMIGRSLGAVDALGARSTARRMLEGGVVVGIGFGVVLAAVGPWLVTVFSDDPGVQHLAQELLWIVAALQPLSAIVFVLDGVLIGAGDQRFLAFAMLAATFGVYVTAAAIVTIAGGGVVALWVALALWIGARAVGLSARYLGDRWQVTGATIPH